MFVGAREDSPSVGIALIACTNHVGYCKGSVERLRPGSASAAADALIVTEMMLPGPERRHVDSIFIEGVSRCTRMESNSSSCWNYRFVLPGIFRNSNVSLTAWMSRGIGVVKKRAVEPATNSRDLVREPWQWSVL